MKIDSNSNRCSYSTIKYTIYRFAIPYLLFTSFVNARSIAMVTRGADDESVGANDTVLLLGDGVDRPFACGGLDEGLG